ncbi:MAG: ABC transporter substrate-binding protein [Bryobacteraceae bacterium]
MAIAVLLLLGFGAASCTKRAEKPVVLTLIDQGWLDKEFQQRRSQESEEFKRQTKIEIEVLPSPESAVEQLALWQQLLQSRSSTPDVYALDIIWPPILAQYFVDLRPYMTAEEMSAYFPALIASNTVKDRLTALPYTASTGLLFYRTDLLREYGFKSPPATWDEMYTMASRIQAGERGKGINDFWGFVWQGAPSEALTCNALEWQASEGGGDIIERDKTVSVNNPNTVRAWQRAARWVGSISPPGVIDYREWDAFNIWQSGKAAFMRNWSAADVVSRSLGSAIRDKFDLTLLPAGSAGHKGVLGAITYGVSQYSLHPREAVQLVRYLCGRENELHWARINSEPPAMPELYREPRVIKANPHFALFKQALLKGVARPSAVTGPKYPQISQAYFEQVHSVLMGRKSAERAAADLERELVRITGFKTPSAGSNVLPIGTK